MENNLVRVTGLWLTESKSGEKYFRGNLTPTSQVMIFKNKKKERDTHPDYHLFIAPSKKKEDGEQPAPEAPAKDVESLDDIPF